MIHPPHAASGHPNKPPIEDLCKQCVKNFDAAAGSGAPERPAALRLDTRGALTSCDRKQVTARYRSSPEVVSASEIAFAAAGNCGDFTRDPYARRDRPRHRLGERFAASFLPCARRETAASAAFARSRPATEGICFSRGPTASNLHSIASDPSPAIVDPRLGNCRQDRCPARFSRRGTSACPCRRRNRSPFHRRSCAPAHSAPDS